VRFPISYASIWPDSLRVHPIESQLPYLVELVTHLAAGLERLPADQRKKLVDFFRSQQCTDGGFRGRGDQSDLYYTAFALRALVVLGSDADLSGHRAADYLRSQLNARVGVVDLISLVFAGKLLESWLGITVFPDIQSNLRPSIPALLEQLRRPDGGYAKAAEGHASSTYQTFLIALVYQLLEFEIPDPDRVSKFILGQQREDGGFVEIGVMRRSGTNPTAAAVGTLRILQSDKQSLLGNTIREQVTGFLVKNQTDEGGLRANTQIPIADLLSTYTGLQTLHDLGTSSQLDGAGIMRYANSLQQDGGGFLAAAWDELSDVEYSFYGIATMGLLLAYDDLSPRR